MTILANCRNSIVTLITTHHTAVITLRPAVVFDSNFYPYEVAIAYDGKNSEIIQINSGQAMYSAMKLASNWIRTMEYFE